jgi:hypothetical protein
MQLTRIAQTCLLTLFGVLAGHASAEAALVVGVRTLAALATDYLYVHAKP